MMAALAAAGALNPGTKVTIGEREYTAPPLTLRGLREVSPLLKYFATTEQEGVRVWADVEGLRDLLVRSMVMSLRRNYGDAATDNWLLDEMLAAEVEPALNAMSDIFQCSGIVKKQPQPGEAVSRSE